MLIVSTYREFIFNIPLPDEIPVKLFKELSLIPEGD